MILRSCIYVHVSKSDAKRAFGFALKVTENDAIQATRSVRFYNLSALNNVYTWPHHWPRFHRTISALLGKKTLRDYILNLEYLDEDQSRDVVKQLAFALCYLKRKGVLHRDIKPENVVIND